MRHLTFINCFLTIIFSVTIIPCLTSSLRELTFLKTLFKKDDSIPTKVFNEVLKRRIDKINEFKERNNLTSEELVFCDFASHSLRLMHVLLNSSSRPEFIHLRSNSANSYHKIVASFHEVFDNERTPSVDYEPVLQRNTLKIVRAPITSYCGCYPVEDKTLSPKTVYPKLKLLMLIDDYKNDFNLYLDYRKDQKQYLSSIIDALETLKLQISNATAEEYDLLDDNQKLNAETMIVSLVRFECIVKMTLDQIAMS